MDKPTNQLERDRLDSWKEIAEHVGRDVRTAIRWEHERGLPVHRVPGGRRGAVFAFRHEIDEWLSGPDAAGRNGSAKAVREPEAPGDPSGSDRRLATPGASRSALTRTAVIAAIVLGVLGGAAYAVRGRVGGSPRPEGDQAIATLSFGAREVTALTASGAPAWTHAFDRALAPVTRNNPGSQFAVADLDGDGRNEMLASITFSLPGHSAEDELYCFSSDGRVLWSFVDRTPLFFRGGTYGPPFWHGNVVVYRVERRWRIAWSQLHSVWWPSRITILDGQGHSLESFVHSGSVYVLALVDDPTAPLLLAGGVSNAHRAAMLAVLDGRHAAGHSPDPPGSPFECLGCSPGGPLRYFIFPPSEVNRAVEHPYNQTCDIMANQHGIDVFTCEAAPDDRARLVFRFSRDLELIHAAASDSWAIHDRLHREGRLDHSSKDCPEYSRPPAARSLDRSGRWIALRPPSVPRRPGAAPADEFPAPVARR